jgi:hypothetical protein
MLAHRSMLGSLGGEIRRPIALAAVRAPSGQSVFLAEIGKMYN